MTPDQPAPTVLDPPLGAAVRDRFCWATVFDYREGVPVGSTPCGGELRLARRVEGELLVTYLQCRFCGHLTRMLEDDMRTGENRPVEGEG